MVRRIGPVEDAAAIGAVSVTVRRTDWIPEEETGGIGVYAAEPELLDTLHATLADGVFLNDATARYPAVVLGAKAAERLGIASVDGGTRVFIGGHWFTVVGILEAMELTPGLDRSVFVGFPVAEELFDHSGSASTVYVRTDPSQVDAVRSVLPATANPEHPNEVQVNRPSDALEARATIDEALTQLLLGLGVVALVVGGVGIANVMVISVLERRSEIGVRRALGASRGHVRSQFLVEAVLLSALGGLGGVLLGVGITVAYADHRSWTLDVPLAAVAGGVGAALAVGALAGLYPAVRAARLSPVEAIRPA
jgi:putative ABC transport system permease protein